MIDNSTFQESVAIKIRNSLAGELSTQLDSLRKDMKLVRLQVLYERVKSNEDLDENDRIALREDLFGLALIPEIVSSPSYRIALRNAADFFFQRGFSREIDQLDDQIGDVIRSSRENIGPMIRMMQHYGLRVLGKMEEVKPSQYTVDKFLSYADALKKNRYYLQAAHYVIAYFFETRPEGWEKVVRDIWVDVEHLQSGEKAALFDCFDYCSDVRRLSRTPRGVHVKLSESMKNVMSSYPTELGKLEIEWNANQNDQGVDRALS